MQQRTHAAVYANRRRIRGERSPQLRRKRFEFLEHPFAHVHETDGMRQIHPRGHRNIVKGLLMHAAGFSLGLLLRRLFSIGTALGLQGLTRAFPGLLQWLTAVWSLWPPQHRAVCSDAASPDYLVHSRRSGYARGSQ
jgi:transposase